MKISYLVKSSFSFLFLFYGCLSAQNFKYQDYTWDDSAKYESLPDSLDEEDAVFLNYFYAIEFNSQIENTNNQQLQLEHYKVFLNSDKAIESYNSIYIPFEDEKDRFNGMKVRVIQPDSKVLVLDKKDIKKGVDEDTGTEYKYFAVEGLQKGSIIELLIKSQVTPQFYGRVIYMQRRYPIFNYHFQHISEPHLKYSFKAYNCDHTFNRSEDEEEIIHDLKKDYLPKYKSEPLSYDKLNMEYLIFKLDKNYSSESLDINGFGFFSQLIGKRIFSWSPEKKEAKLLKSSFKDIDIIDDDSQEVKVLKIENYLKQNFAFVDGYDTELEDVERVFQDNAYNIFGALRLYKEYFHRANIPFQIVATSDKTRFKFDEDFENHLFVDKLLVYLSDAKICLDPADKYSRLQFYDTRYQGHKGLFMKSRTIGNTQTCIGKVKEIPSTTGKESLHFAKIDVDIKKGFEEVSIAVDLERTGHTAKLYQPVFREVLDEYQDNFYNYTMHTYANQYDVESLKFENTDQLDFPLKPFIARLNLESDNFWQKAGKSYILNLGDLIGPQSQMYNEDASKRITDINTSYARRFQYRISVNVPEGYTAENLENLNMNVDGSDENFTYYFKSNYELKENKILVTVDELYDHSHYPAERFESYVNVINAAADFNKIKVVFKPK